MGILKRAGDLVYTFRFLRLLTTSFEDTEAFKKGIIDKDGKRKKEFKLDTMDNRDDYSNYYIIMLYYYILLFIISLG